MNKLLVLGLLLSAVAVLLAVVPASKGHAPYAYGVSVAHADDDPICPNDKCDVVRDLHGHILGTRCAVGEIDGGGCDSRDQNGRCIPQICP